LFEKSRYLEDRDISRLTTFTFPRAHNVLQLPIDVQSNLSLCHCLGTFDSWKIRVKGENIEVYLDRAMYF